MSEISISVSSFARNAAAALGFPPPERANTLASLYSRRGRRGGGGERQAREDRKGEQEEEEEEEEQEEGTDSEGKRERERERDRVVREIERERAEGGVVLRVLYVSRRGTEQRYVHRTLLDEEEVVARLRLLRVSLPPLPPPPPPPPPPLPLPLPPLVFPTSSSSLSAREEERREGGKVGGEKGEGSSRAGEEEKASLAVTVVDFVGMAMREQVAAVRAADVIISMHGAGLANLLWARRGTAVVEIFPAEKRRYGYEHLSAMLGLEYAEFRGGRDSAFGEHKTLLVDELDDDGHSRRDSEWERWIGGAIETAIRRAAGKAEV